MKPQNFIEFLKFAPSKFSNNKTEVGKIGKCSKKF